MSFIASAIAVNASRLSGGSAGGLDPDVQAFIDAIVNDGGSLTAVEEDALNTMVESLKTELLWSEFYALYPIVGGTSTTHKYNLKDPQDTDAAFRLTFNGGITHSSTGMLGNGTNGYANTHFTPDGSLTSSSSSSYHVYLRNSVLTINMADLGMYQGPPYYYTWIAPYHNSIAFWDGVGFAPIVNAQSNPTTKLFSMSRTGTTTLKAFRDGTQIGSTGTGAQGAFPAVTASKIALIARMNQGNASASLFSTRESAFGAIGNGLDVGQIATFNDIIVTFQTTLGRNV